MNIPTIQKKPGEDRTVECDFTTKLAAGDSLSGSPTVTADSPITTVSNRVANSVFVRLGGGIDGADYGFKIVSPTTNGDTLALSGTLEVREDVN